LDGLKLQTNIAVTDIWYANPVCLGFEFLSAALNFLRLLSIIHRYDWILFHGHTFASLWLPLLKRIPFSGIPPIALVEFNLEAKTDTVLCRCKYLALKFIYKKVDLILPFTTSHANYIAKEFNLRQNRVISVHQPASYGPLQLASDTAPNHGGYVLALGRTDRDYQTFFTAVEEVNAEVIVIASKHQFRNVRIPSNVTVKTDVPMSEYEWLIRNAQLVVIPLRQTVHPVGLRTLFMAMERCRAVVITDTLWSTEYFGDSRCLRFVPPYDSVALRSAIAELLSDERLTQQMGMCAREMLDHKFTSKHYLERIMTILEQYEHKI
jgi:glycosyltransferase involved in cell wall biosynthesis